MIFLKLYYRIYGFFIILFYRIIFAGKVSFGKHLHVRKRFHITIDNGGKLMIGDNCFFNNDCGIHVRKQIEIGPGCIFGENVMIYDHNHIHKDPKIPLKNQGFTEGSILIGSDCWIASNVVILKGVMIGDNVVIGAGCVIYQSIPDHTTVKNANQLELIQNIR